MSLRPIEPVALGDRTLTSIRDAIVSGVLPAGEVLRDRQLAEALGVSRTPVREALHRLESGGLVVARGRSGWMVSLFTEQDVREIFEMRALLEPAGLESLEREPDPAVVSRLADFFGDYAHPLDPDRHEEYLDHDQAFHRLIVACSPNARLRTTYAELQHHIDRGRHFLLGTTLGRADETLDEHLAVSAAVARGDYSLARRELVRHLRTGERLMLDALSSRG